MLDPEMLEQFQMVVNSVQNMIENSEHRMKIYLETEVNKRIDSLFDGYKLTHEKQWELEKETERLKKQVDDLQSRLTVLKKYPLNKSHPLPQTMDG